jgi:DNA segregation ATPase FtsK/SpoIIIE-like protein
MGIMKDLLAWPLKMKHKLDGLFVIPIGTNDLDKAAYIKRIESGVWKDKVVLGIADKFQDFVTTDPVLAPGQMMIGGMGSGKSVAAKFTVYTHMACNSENTFYILVDPEKGMTDYKSAFKYKDNVVTALNAAEKFIPIMDMLAEEASLRKFEFSRVGATNIYEYENIMRKEDPSFPGLARIMLCFEEFHALINHKQINFQMNIDKPSMAAGQFKNLMRVGRSMGFNVTIATQRATSEDVPTSLRPGLSIIMAFRVNNPGDAAIANLPGAADILSSQRGRCVWEQGQMQFPWLYDKAGHAFSDELLSTYVKPLKAKLLGKQVPDYHLATSGEGTEGFVWVKPLTQLLDAKGQFEPKNIAKRILKEVDFTFEEQGNEALIANLIAERDGIRYAVVVSNDRDDASPKAILNLESSLEQLNCTRVMGICLESVGTSLSALCAKTGGMLVEKDELKQFAKVVDNRAKFAPEKYKERFDQFSLTRAFQNKKHSTKGDSDPVSEMGDDEEDEDFMQAVIRRRLGEPESNPKKFRG